MNQNTTIFTEEGEFEKFVCGYLSRPQFVILSYDGHTIDVAENELENLPTMVPVMTTMSLKITRVWPSGILTVHRYIGCLGNG